MVSADRGRALLDELPEDLRHLLMLRVAAGLSTDETADALGMPARAVRIAQHRALAHLRTLVALDDDAQRIDQRVPGGGLGARSASRRGRHRTRRWAERPARGAR